MKYEDYTAEQLADMASVCNDDIASELKLRPNVQAELIRRGLMSLDELTDSQIQALDDYVFDRDWLNVDRFLRLPIIKTRILVEMMYSGEIPFIRTIGGTFCRRREFTEAFGDKERFAGECNRNV